jgi:flagellar basal-body rod modification protein FlgD
MVTQLKNQDPTQPMSNEDMLQQMTNIGQLESSDQLQSSLTSMTLQNSIGDAANLIGKSVIGLNDQQQQVNGVVNSVQVQNSLVYLQLDSGSTLQLGNVTAISPASTTPTTGS